MYTGMARSRNSPGRRTIGPPAPTLSGSYRALYHPVPTSSRRAPGLHSSTLLLHPIPAGLSSQSCRPGPLSFPPDAPSQSGHSLLLRPSSPIRAAIPWEPAEPSGCSPGPPSSAPKPSRQNQATAPSAIPARPLLPASFGAGPFPRPTAPRPRRAPHSPARGSRPSSRARVSVPRFR